MGKRLLITGGRLLDAGQGFDGEELDIFIEDGVIREIGLVSGCDRPADGEFDILDADGAYVAPGFIDGHVHAYSAIALGVPADEIGVKTGTTTMIDAGSAGPENLADFIERDIIPAKTRIFSAMHYAKTGLLNMPEADEESKYDLKLAKEAYEKYKDYIVAIKGRASNSCVGELGITSIQAGKKLAKELGLPYLVHIGNMPPKIEAVLSLMEKGDVITHAFHGKKNNLFKDQKIKPETQAARARGVCFDLGHGEASFNFNTARLAKQLGFEPDMISSDLHARNYRGPVYSLAVTMDKMMALGFSLAQCVAKVTTKPAEQYRLERLGRLEPGCYGDFTIFRLREGAYTFTDADGNELKGTTSIDVQYAIVGGEIVMRKQSAAVSEELLEQVRNELELTTEVFAPYRQNLITVMEYLKTQQVEFAEHNRLAFANHIVTLFMRLETGEKVAGMGLEVLDQISAEALDQTEALLAQIAALYGPADESEKALVAVHIYTAIEMMKGNAI